MIRKYMMAALVIIALLGACITARAEGDAEWRPNITGKMPVVSIVTSDGSNDFATAYVRENKLNGQIDYVGATVSVSSCESHEALTNAAAQVKVRGNWTLDYPKKSIRIKFDEKHGMLGLNGGQAYKSWVLLAEWKDLSMLNTPVAMYLAHHILGRDGYYCADYCFVQLYINNEYWGVYLLTEQQEVNPGRVDITEPEKDSAEKYTGYFFEYDAYYQEEKALPQADEVFAVYHTGLEGEQYGYTIKSNIYSGAQRRFLRSYVQSAYKICYEAIVHNQHYAFNESYTGVEAVAGVSVQDTVGRVVDLTSLVDMYILHEITCNPDVGWSSFYFSLDMGERGNKKLTFQAPWDFDSSFGIRSGYESTQGMYAAQAGNPWLRLFASESWFVDMVKQRWAEIKADGIPEKALQLIGEFKETYAAYFDQNYQRWPGRIAEGNHELIEELNSCQSQGEAADYLYRWLDARLAWLDEQWR